MDILMRRISIQLFFLSKKYQLLNVAQILERRLVLDEYLLSFKTIFAYDLNHLLAMRLRKLKSSEELTSILRMRNIDQMSGEAMKQCVKFFFEH
uniref:NR LBD domain-containing protein n=1 Tax=Caenorhabditis tropicalis TaxID=1561998 RepID=A0A1I7UKR6_9PELO